MKRFYRAVALALLSILLVSSIALAAWTFKFPTIVQDTGGVSRTYYPVDLGYDAATLLSSGKIAANGLNTNMQVGSNNVAYMMDTTRVMAVVPSLGADSMTTVDLYTGYTPNQTSFDIVVGEGGYITTADDDDIELGASFDISLSGYFVTSAAMIGENILYKQDSFRVYVQAAGTIRAAILSAGDVEEKTVSGAVSSGAHILRIYTSGSTLSLGLDGVRIAHTHLDLSVTAGDTLYTTTGPLYASYGRVRHGFYGNGRYWVFWGKSNYVQYQSSVDGDTWTAPATAVSGLSTGSYWDSSDFITDGTYVYVAYRTGTVPGVANFRKGTLNTDGSITWIAGASVIGTIGGSITGMVPTIALDSNGDVYCAIYNPSDDFVYLDKLVTGSSTWVSATGFPKKSGLGPNGHIPGGQKSTWITPMASGRMYISSAEDGVADQKHGQVFNGTTFESYDHLATFMQQRFVSYGDIVYHLDGSGDDSTVAIRTYGIGWAAATNIGTPAGGSGANDRQSIGVDVSTGDVFVTRSVASSDIVYYKKYDMDSETWDANWTTLSDESTDKWLGYNELCYSSGAGSRMGCAYLTETLDAGDPIVKCAFINLNSNPVPDTANDYVLMDGNTMAYADYITFTVTGTEVLKYQPNTIVVDTALPDRDTADDSQDGVITWGANSDVTITYGLMEGGSGAPTSFSASTTTGFDPGTADMPTTWYGSCGNVVNLPFYESFYEVSVQTGQSVCDIYFLIMVGVAFGVLLLLTMTTRSALIGATGFNIALYAASSTGIIPMWIPFSTTIIQIGVLFLYKQVAY
jgi:hypothetical protein